MTPCYRGKEKIARGVKMEAWSVEDKGKLHFNVYVHNVQNGVIINYYSGASKAAKTAPKKPAAQTKPQTGKTVFYLNISTLKFHKGSCRYSSGKNIEQTNLTAAQLIKNGYSPCKVCHPEK